MREPDFNRAVSNLSGILRKSERGWLMPHLVPVLLARKDYRFAFSNTLGRLLSDSRLDDTMARQLAGVLKEHSKQEDPRDLVRYVGLNIGSAKFAPHLGDFFRLLSGYSEKGGNAFSLALTLNILAHSQQLTKKNVGKCFDTLWRLHRNGGNVYALAGSLSHASFYRKYDPNIQAALYRAYMLCDPDNHESLNRLLDAAFEDKNFNTQTSRVYFRTFRKHVNAGVGPPVSAGFLNSLLANGLLSDRLAKVSTDALVSARDLSVLNSFGYMPDVLRHKKVTPVVTEKYLRTIADLSRSGDLDNFNCSEFHRWLRKNVLDDEWTSEKSVGEVLDVVSAHARQGHGEALEFMKELTRPEGRDQFSGLDTAIHFNRSKPVAFRALEIGVNPRIAMAAARYLADTEKQFLDGSENHDLQLTPAVVGEIRGKPTKEIFEEIERRSHLKLRLATPRSLSRLAEHPHLATNPRLRAYLYALAGFIPEGKKRPLFDSFTIKTRRMLTHVPEEVSKLINDVRGSLPESSMDSSALGARAAELQRLVDSGRKDKQGELFRTHLLLALENQQVRDRVNSPDAFTALEALHDLYSDRVRDAADSTEGNPDRVTSVLQGNRALLMGAGVSGQNSPNEIRDQLEFNADAPDARRALRVKYQKDREELKKAINLAKEAGDFNHARSLGVSVPKLKSDFEKKLAALDRVTEGQAAAARKLLSLLSPSDTYEDKVSKQLGNAFRQLKSVASGEDAELEFDSAPSVRDAVAGYASGDCTEGQFDRFDAPGVWNIKVWLRGQKGRKHVGNIYAALSEDGNLVNLEAIQLPYNVDHEQLARELPPKLLKRIRARRRKVSRLSIADNPKRISNHLSVSTPWDEAYKNARKETITLNRSAIGWQTNRSPQRIIASSRKSL